MGKPKIRFRGYTDDWEQRKVSDIAEIVGGGTPDTSNLEYWDGDIDWYAPAEMGDKIYADGSERKITSLGFQKCSAKMLPADRTILFTSRAGIGKTAILRHSACTNQGFQSLVLKDNIDPYFVYSMSAQLKEKAEAVASGSTFAEISGKMLGNLDIKIPDTLEQLVIGKYFSNLDHLITLHQRKCEETRRLKQYMLQKMFPQDGRCVPEIRFAGFTEDWEQRKLSEVVKEIKRTDETSNAPVMMITAENGFINQSERYSTNNAGQSLKKYILLEKGELAYNHGASKLRPFGSCFSLTTEEKARIPFVYHCFSSDSENSEFLSIELNGKAVESQLRRIVSSGARMDGLLNISFQEYTSIPILLPERAEQDKIADYFRTLDHLITLHQRKWECLQGIKRFMLGRMFL